MSGSFFLKTWTRNKSCISYIDSHFKKTIYQRFQVGTIIIDYLTFFSREINEKLKQIKIF